MRDPCHFTRRYRGVAHYICNLQFKKPKFTPIILQNLAGYDSHLFVKDLGKPSAGSRSVKTEENIKCIPNNEEKHRYKCFSLLLLEVSSGCSVAARPKA